MKKSKIAKEIEKWPREKRRDQAGMVGKLRAEGHDMDTAIRMAYERIKDDDSSND